MSYKMDLDIWDCLVRKKTHIIAKFYRADLVICSHSRKRKPPSYRQINMVQIIS